MIVIAILFFLRHEIIGHAFKVSIKEKTNSTVELEIGQLHYDIFHSTVTFRDSDFAFKNVTINKEKTISLSKFRFDELRLERLSIFKLLFKHELIANKVAVDKPSFWFRKDNNPQPFKEKPKEIIASLKKHPDILGELVVIIGEIEITHGKVDLTSIIDDDKNEGSVEFKLLLKNINTASQDFFNEQNFLFAKHHFFKLSNFNYSFPNGDKIGFDSLVFGSHSNRISLSNIDLKVIDTSGFSSVKYLDAKVGELSFFGIDLLRIDNIQDLYIDSLKISDASVNLIQNKNAKKPPADTTNKIAAITKLFKSINLSELELEDVDVTAGDDNNDSVIVMQDMSFRVKDIVIDSASLAAKMPKYNNESILLSLGDFKFNDKNKGLCVSFRDLFFSEKNRMLSLSDFHVNDRKNGNHSYLIDTDSLSIYGISVDDQLKEKKMKLGLLLSNPEIYIDIEHLKKRAGEQQKTRLNNIIVDELNITNGLIHFSETDKINADITGLNMSWDSINFIDPEKLVNINPDNLEISFRTFQIDLPEKQVSAATGLVELTNTGIELVNLTASIVDPDKLNTMLSIKTISMDGGNFKNALINKELTFNNISIAKPDIVTKIFYKERKVNNSSHKDTGSFDYIIDVKSFNISEGEIDLDYRAEKPVKLKSDFYLKTANINITDLKNIDWLHNITWDINLNNTWFENEEYNLVCDELVSDKNKEILRIKNFHLYENEMYNGNRRVEIVDFSLPYILLEGVSYTTIIENETPLIGLATIEDANLDIKMDTRIDGSKKDTAIASSKLPFELDELILNNLTLKFQKHDSISVSNLLVGDLDFRYKLDSAPNFVDDMVYLDIKDISFSDTSKNSSIDIRSIDFDNNVNSIKVKDFYAGNIYDDTANNYHDITCLELDFNELYIGHSYPTSISLGNITLDNVTTNIISRTKNKKDTVRKEVKLPGFIEDVFVGNILAKKIDFGHTTISDTSEKKLSLVNIKLDVDSVQVDSGLLASMDITRFAKRISLNIKDNDFISKDSLYVTNLKSMSYEFGSNKLTLDSLSRMPRYENAEFFKKAVYQTGRMELIAGSIVCSNVRLRDLIDNKKLHIGGVDLYNVNTHIFRNKIYEMNPKAYKPMPQEAILSIPMVITVDSVKTHDAYIQYKEIEKKSVVPGELFLNKFNLAAYNINNNRDIINDSSRMVVKLDAMFMGQADLRIIAEFPILSPDYEFRFTGHMDILNFPELNNLTENLVGVTMAKGAGTLDIPWIKGNATYSEGEILFKYKKLKIELYNREKAKITKGLTGSMANLLLNDIIIKSNNPGFLGRTRPGEVYFKRNTQKSIVQYMWKSIMSGLMSTMGYNNKEQRQEKRAFRKASKRK